MPDILGGTETRDVQDLIELYKKHWSSIRIQFQTKGKLRHSYNIRLRFTSIDELTLAAYHIFETQSTAFKINLEFGFFWRNVETCKLQYYYSFNNTRLFSEPILVHDLVSYRQFKEQLSSKDPIEHARLARPNSKWVVELVTDVNFYVYKLRDHPIGEFSNFVKKNKSLVSLEKDRNSGLPSNDNLCLFRCFALHRGASVKGLTKTTLEL